MIVTQDGNTVLLLKKNLYQFNSIEQQSLSRRVDFSFSGCRLTPELDAGETVGVVIAPQQLWDR